ncbi:MAG: metal-dependent transcriptional regulator, partial [Spirochaetota bacterium]
VGVSTASVTHAFRALRSRGLIEYERYQAVRLTGEGPEAARLVIARKKTLIRFFSEVLGLERGEAEQNAHRMEHMITSNAIERLGELIARYDAGVPISRETPDPTDR